MAKIIGVEGMTKGALATELQQGARFVVFPYVFSVLIMTFRRSSDIYYIRPGESGLSKGWPFLLISLFLGWWGIPWGFIYTPGALYHALRGGKDVTKEVAASLLPVEYGTSPY